MQGQQESCDDAAFAGWLFGSTYQLFVTLNAFSSILDHQATPKHFYEFETHFYVLSWFE